ncbi:carbon-nitrogen hydrolase family protein [Pseudomonas yamanorum]|uniref:carbon-nitrogen hydrolase family protein n=1 Tax=Pseudomonas yamanorum TaxID=515393 RepID=UPI003F751925
MKLVAAQISSIAGDIGSNITKHISVIEQAANRGATGIFFPELSLTGYEPTLAQDLAILPDDPRLNVFQDLSDRLNILVSLGAPIQRDHVNEISMIIFQPNELRCTYSKQLLHPDELPFFSMGNEQRIINHSGHKLAPAICYESLQSNHAKQAAELGAEIYIASVAKPERGVAVAYSHYPFIAREHGMIVLMANSVGPSDDFTCAGKSGVWTNDGDLVICADSASESLIMYDFGPGKGELIVL